VVAPTEGLGGVLQGGGGSAGGALLCVFAVARPVDVVATEKDLWGGT
jgi:hypothetical protein